MDEQVAEQTSIFKDSKKHYVEIQEEKLYEKYEITEANGRSEKDRGINYCFVTFRSMKGKVRCEAEFADCEALAKENPEEGAKVFMDKFLEVREAKPPGALQWSNISYSWCNRRTRTVIMWLLALAFVSGGFALVLYFTEKQAQLTSTAGAQTKCPPASEAPDLEMIVDDFKKTPK